MHQELKRNLDKLRLDKQSEKQVQMKDQKLVDLLKR